MTVEELGKTLSIKELSEIIEGATPSPDLTPWGLVPRATLTDKLTTGVASIDDAVDAAAGGVWRPAADLLAESYGQWDFRARVVHHLAEVAAADDAWLVAWRAANPDDGHAGVVDCDALTNLAWQLRGGSGADQTSAEQFAGFHRVLAQAKTVAYQATRALPDDPTPWSALVTIARGLGYDHSEFEEVWRNVTERAPLHRRAHASALQYWCEKWYGSHERMFAFAEQAAALSPPLSSLVLRAAYEMHGDDPKVWQQSNVRDALDTFLRWLETDGAHNVDLRDDLGWAALALVESGRGAEAIPIFKQLGPHAGGMPWWLSPNPVKMFNDYRVRACTGKPRRA